MRTWLYAKTWLYANLGGLGYASCVVAAALFRRDDIQERLPIRRLLAGRLDRSPDSIWKKQARERLQ
jgi:hypothetical protein